MWYIKNAQGEITYLKPNKLMTVSRKEGHDIVLRDDDSVSKVHASIIVRPKVHFKNNEPSSTVTIKDTGSKYGTFIIDCNNKQRKLTPGDHNLTATDKVKFGLGHGIFTLHYVPLIISTSTLNNDEKTELRNYVDTLDGVIIEKWEEYCTHLTVSNVRLTSQVVQALAFGTPIITLKYWHAVVKSVENNEKLPDTANFIPTINEGLINREIVSLEVNLRRKVLFKNLFFICFDTSQYSLENIIKYAGGKLKLYKEGQFDLKQLCSENFVLLQFGSNTSQPSQASVTLYDSIQRTLQKRKLRFIPESEIFLAILYCSIEKYCNPKFDFKRLIGTLDTKRSTSSSTILAPDTEDVLSTTQDLPAVIIKESLTLSEQAEEQESGNLRKVRLSLGRKRTSDNIKDSSQLSIGSKRTSERQAFGSEESSREGALMIDETGSSVESDSNDMSIKRRDSANEFEEPLEKSKSASQSTVRRFNLQSKLQTPKVQDKVNSDYRETRAISSNRNLEDNFFSNPSTSRKSRENHRDIINDIKPDNMELRKAAGSASVTDGPKFSKRNRTDEDDMFSFVNEGITKRNKKNVMEDDGDDLFELLEDPNAKTSYKEENIFEKELNRIKRCQNKRRRSSLSSNDSSIEDEQPKVKVETIDIESDTDIAPLIQCKKELDNSMDDTCKSSMVSLLRTDIDLTLDSSAGNLKTFVKVYTSIPKQRIKLKNMYVWKSRDDCIKYDYEEEELTSSADDDDDFKFYNSKVPKKGRARK